MKGKLAELAVNGKIIDKVEQKTKILNEKIRLLRLENRRLRDKITRLEQK